MKPAVTLFAALSLVACSQEAPQAAAPAVSHASTASVQPKSDLFVPAWDGAVVKGKVVFEGTAPRDKKIALDADPYCTQANADPMKTEVYVIGKSGEMANIVVWVKKGLPDKKYDAPKEAAVLDQKSCRYSPHVLPLMVGQTLKIRNSDDTMHNVHGLGTVNPEFNFGQAKKGGEEDKVFASAEFIKIKCDVHGWMSAWVAVIPHPYFAVTGADGLFAIQGLPAGEYEVEAWHEKLGVQSATVKIGDKESKDVNFTFKPAK